MSHRCITRRSKFDASIRTNCYIDRASTVFDRFCVQRSLDIICQVIMPSGLLWFLILPLCCYISRFFGGSPFPGTCTRTTTRSGYTICFEFSIRIVDNFKLHNPPFSERSIALADNSTLMNENIFFCRGILTRRSNKAVSLLVRKPLHSTLNLGHDPSLSRLPTCIGRSTVSCGSLFKSEVRFHLRQEKKADLLLHLGCERDA
mmetsp:Transcript_27950/g.39360  ORF Transcript_27950/g.39360 Transcript_27950/m.39360 type:complete len:203 (+) Transcript_27950:262-870(+)